MIYYIKYNGCRWKVKKAASLRDACNAIMYAHTENLPSLVSQFYNGVRKPQVTISIVRLNDDFSEVLATRRNTMRNREAHAAYEKAHEDVRAAVDEAFIAMKNRLEEFGYNASKVDPAEELVAEIYRYVLVSNPNQQRVLPNLGVYVDD